MEEHRDWDGLKAYLRKSNGDITRDEMDQRIALSDGSLAGIHLGMPWADLRAVLPARGNSIRLECRGFDQSGAGYHCLEVDAHKGRVVAHIRYSVRFLDDDPSAAAMVARFVERWSPVLGKPRGRKRIRWRPKGMGGPAAGVGREGAPALIEISTTSLVRFDMDWKKLHLVEVSVGTELD